MSDRILIIDFGSQVTQLIARRVRESGVYSEVHPFNAVSVESVAKFDPNGIILSGGPASITGMDTPRVPEGLFHMGLPVLGICYGQMAMAEALGGQVISSDHREFGRAFVEVADDCDLFHGVWDVGSTEQVWMSHGDRIDAAPAGFRTVASSEGAPFAAIADDQRHFYGLMFHPEVVHTPHGAKLLENFTHRVCGCAGDWTMAGFREQEIAKVREQVGDGKVICGLSGGVDSSVVAVLLHEAIGDQLQCVYVDTGFMRLGETEEVLSLFRDHYNIPLVHRDASDLFIDQLIGEVDPEKKRKIIGA
ncbi:MAG TPA: glutamine-hydrolyzing GMP synthase, partial [Rhodospirillales bacterium]|nr:glutamine-hydrolyzing GMP synthase [Rhodospirillales bacterium]